MTHMYAPPHPGKVLREYLGENTVTDAAKALGVHRASLSRVLSGTSAISPDLAFRLGMAFATSPDFWAGMQLKYDLYMAGKIKRPKIKRLYAVLIKDRSVLELKGMFVPPAGRKVFIEDMRVNSEPTNMAAWEAIKPIGREFGSTDYERLERLDALAFQVLGSMKKARRWLGTPHDDLGGRTPQEVAGTKVGFRRVKRILQLMQPKA